MAVTVALLASRAREDAGRPSTKEIEDLVIERHVGDAILETSKYVPHRAFYSITLVENKQDYDAEADVVDVIEAFPWWGETISDYFGGEFDAVLKTDILYDWEMYRYKKLINYINKLLYYENFSWDFNPSEMYEEKGNQGMLFVMPPPTAAYVGKKMYYVGVKDWVIGTLPSKLEKLVVKYATAHTLRIIGRYRARMSSPTRAGTSTDYSIYDSVSKDGERLLTEWRNEMEAESNRWFWK